MKNSELQERLRMLEKGMEILEEDFQRLKRMDQTLKEIQGELKGLKIYLSRIHPEFTYEFPSIMKKVKD